jgi:large subunit ribosomal protein L12
MEYVYACMLLHSTKKEINEVNIKAVLKAAGVAADDGRIKSLLAALEGVNIEEAIKSAAMPVAAAPAAAAPSAKKEEKKEEEKKEEKKEEEALEGLGALFG